MSRAWLVANALWLQAGWWACVLGAHHPLLLIGVIGGLAVHLAGCPYPRAETAAILRVALCGCALDASLGAMGLFAFGQVLLPPWLVLLWLVFASGLRHSLARLRRPLWLAMLVGALAGPLAYIAGAGLAGIGLPLGNVHSALLLAPLWALWLPLSLRLAHAPAPR
ncbi:DUF2878 domain-containing protein [Pseudomonas knackmussii]|uniref:DUF2878 domain-containing protein n=1 Tax=Pseudomonas knackmussii TaxID=65741 RepID=UPI003F49BAE3